MVTHGHKRTHADTDMHRNAHERAHAHACARTTYVSSIRGKRVLYDLHTGHTWDLTIRRVGTLGRALR